MARGQENVLGDVGGGREGEERTLLAQRVGWRGKEFELLQ